MAVAGELVAGELDAEELSTGRDMLRASRD
jgi:hypothetical protein